MRFVSAVLLLVVVVMASASAKPEKKIYDLDKAEVYFNDFIKENNRQYKDEADKQLHYEAFKKNLAHINELNKGDSTAEFGINLFADYTEEEQKTLFGLKLPNARNID